MYFDWYYLILVVPAMIFSLIASEVKLHQPVPVLL